jgi:hypothetical protein
MHSPQSRQWRDEKVFIVFHAHRVELKALAGRKIGDWVVTPGDKPISRSQTVTWQAVPDAELEVFLPDVFEPHHLKAKGQVSATVRDNAPIGYYEYEVYCNGQLAVAGSPPVIIVDP